MVLTKPRRLQLIEILEVSKQGGEARQQKRSYLERQDASFAAGRCGGDDDDVHLASQAVPEHSCPNSP